MRQPEVVSISVASPLAPGARSVGARAAWKRSPDVPEPNTRQPDSECKRGNSRRGADEDEVPRRRPARRALLHLDSRPQVGGRLESGHGVPRKLERSPLLGEPLGELGGLGDSGLERGTALRCERPVRECGQLR